ncbi:protein pangolin-like isoform X2 [Dunckerocampus dactyliophorus]|uniref:protein pangolin-like isoform X2 n=1 Tax=Dunckerocampus dactyliophorus TaxID=161453 RepID=UPI002404BB41|nr:protein pangolin-like isoform X2 [Dunckerocampus dactyliophorus]
MDHLQTLLTEEDMKWDKLLDNVIKSADVILWGTTPTYPPYTPPLQQQPPPPPPPKDNVGSLDCGVRPPLEPAAGESKAPGDFSPLGDARQQLGTLMETPPCMDDDLANVLDDFWLPDYLASSQGSINQANDAMVMPLAEDVNLPLAGRQATFNGEMMCGATSPTDTFDLATNSSQCISQCYKNNNQQEGERPYIKKPPNAFMLFRKEQSPNVVAQFNITNSAAVNKILGKMWKSLPKKLQAKYYQQAEEHKLIHSLQHPNWSCTENYGKKRKRDRGKQSAGVSVTTEDLEDGPYCHYHECAVRDTQPHGC